MLNTNSYLNKKRLLPITFADVLPNGLSYQIGSWSSFVKNYHSQNILHLNNNPLSKWMIHSNKNNSEYVMLKLNKISIIRRVLFIKLNKPSCMKEFKLYFGLNKHNMKEVLHSSFDQSKSIHASFQRNTLRLFLYLH